MKTVQSFLESIQTDDKPPQDLSDELKALWYSRAGNWEQAHDIAQEIPTKMGSWIHGLLHAMEGDFGNSGYWFHRAGKAPISKSGIDAEWETLVQANLSE
ncbi:MAG: hypothetical protein KA250_06545 [Verrucomicrobiales bacterium]|jgi:hypothetical protein|nr:hypothetical protein [Verrucomicrobiales bacterium]MBP9223719.1 hypothetical protein [Verrucomicrobiales bacterium]HQZ29969.1 hypothetical protein [Verrucomicrobiales bacterium]